MAPPRYGGARKLTVVADPNPSLAKPCGVGVQNCTTPSISSLIPVIQTREMESLMRVQSGQTVEICATCSGVFLEFGEALLELSQAGADELLTLLGRPVLGVVILDVSVGIVPSGPVAHSDPKGVQLDIDGSTDNSVQPVALQYRVGSTGDFVNVPAGIITSIVTPLALLLIFLPGPAAALVAWIVSTLLDFLLKVLEIALRLPGASVRIPSPPLWLWFFYGPGPRARLASDGNGDYATVCPICTRRTRTASPPG